MSGYSAALIDPALQDLPPPRTTGMKRKATRSTGPVHAANQQAPTRVTRRQAAASVAAVSAPDHPSTVSSQHVGEPSRGEEENLMRYEWERETTKRSRRRSPSAHQPRGHASPAPSQSVPPLVPASHGATSHPHTPHTPRTPHTPHTPQQSHTPWAGSALPSAHNSPGGASAGIENLAAAAAAYQNNPPRPIYPYPYGLTPFRYECLTPHLPQPPPGDPANPAFKRFDPTHGSVVEPQPQHQQPQQQQHQQGQRRDAPSGAHTPQSVTERPPEWTEHHTLAALLSATEAAGSASNSRPRTPESRR